MTILISYIPWRSVSDLTSFLGSNVRSAVSNYYALSSIIKEECKFLSLCVDISQYLSVVFHFYILGSYLNICRVNDWRVSSNSIRVFFLYCGELDFDKSAWTIDNKVGYFMQFKVEIHLYRDLRSSCDSRVLNSLLSERFYVDVHLEM